MNDCEDHPLQPQKDTQIGTNNFFWLDRFNVFQMGTCSYSKAPSSLQRVSIRELLWRQVWSSFISKRRCAKSKPCPFWRKISLLGILTFRWKIINSSRIHWNNISFYRSMVPQSLLSTSHFQKLIFLVVQHTDRSNLLCEIKPLWHYILLVGQGCATRTMASSNTLFTVYIYTCIYNNEIVTHQPTSQSVYCIGKNIQSTSSTHGSNTNTTVVVSGVLGGRIQDPRISKNHRAQNYP